MVSDVPIFHLPDLGEGLSEARIVRWLVGIGDTVVIDQPVVEVETAKATVELPVPFDGTVAATCAEEGCSVDTGSALIEVVTPSGGSPSPTSGVLVGYGPTASRNQEPRHRPRPTQADGTGASAPRPVISPSVRRMAAGHELALESVVATGPTGVITRGDVQAALSGRTDPELPTAAADGTRSPTPSPRNPADTARSATDSASTRVPLHSRGPIVERLTRSQREIPAATVWVDVDASDLLSARRSLNQLDPDRPVSLLALLSRFAVLALVRHPELNSRVLEEEIVRYDRVGLGVATQTERGLLAPVVPAADELSTRALSAALTDRVDQARSGTLAPADLAGGTFTVNNYGRLGVDGAAAVINHPEVAILGMGRILDRPWARDGAVTVRALTQLTLTFDHRVCDGAVAGGFLRYVADCIEAPIHALGDL